MSAAVVSHVQVISLLCFGFALPSSVPIGNVLSKLATVTWNEAVVTLISRQHASSTTDGPGFCTEPWPQYRSRLSAV